MKHTSPLMIVQKLSYTVMRLLEKTDQEFTGLAPRSVARLSEVFELRIK